MGRYLIVLGVLGALLLLTACTEKSPVAPNPTAGFDLHIDAKRHIASDRTRIAHHYCKGFPEGFFECQLYDGDDPNAKLIGAEVVMGKDTYEQLSEEEQVNWHNHAEEIAREEVEIQLPDLTAEKAGEVAEVLKPTYGKVVIIWDPADPAPQEPQTVII